MRAEPPAVPGPGAEHGAVRSPPDGTHSTPASTCSSVGSSLQSVDCGDPPWLQPRGRAPLVVTTPWQPSGVERGQVRLRDEVSALWSLLQLTLAERSRRDAVIATLGIAAKSVWPEAELRVYGSFACGLALPWSSVDLVCEGSDVPLAREAVRAAGAAGFCAEELQLSPGGEHAFAVLRHADGVVCNLSFVRSRRGAADESVAALRALVAQWPAVPAVFACVRVLLRQSRCGDPRDGGLSSYAALAMTLHAARCTPRPHDPAALLREFCALYGATGRKAEGRMWVEDPLLPGNDVVAECASLPRARMVFHNCAGALAKWDADVDGLCQGRTPLSSIIAHGQLWARAEMKSGAPRCPAWAAHPDTPDADPAAFPTPPYTEIRPR
eukprot:TRINITY_DN15636_c0_g1_i1.p1 TRINITY_DN15636_c0_g1~~TRINITY_DN15636_c0_g1_i1.p1  ORF type:complete len:383 (+),score=71.60 TRINITY_DN15636_c0_g1_i1:106-1254(+)